METTSQPHTDQPSLVRFWGVRGSLPTPGSSTARYGGNTTCLELRIAGEIIIIDAGSGISPLGTALIDEFGMNPISIALLNTHTHWDHIQGFPFFIPAYMHQNRIRVIGRDPSPKSLESIFGKMMDGDNCFPIPLEGMKCQISFDHLKPDGQKEYALEKVKFSTCPTNHPGGCLGYRFDTPTGSLVFLSDHETEGPDEPRIREFIHGADILIADTQYTPKEIETRRGWGHGCFRSVVSLAISAGVKDLYMTHHDPAHNDDFIDRMLTDARELVPESSKMNVFAATEGQQVRF
jgi:phosphoribosyl 1,2-cyclic phosphodiesterase